MPNQHRGRHNGPHGTAARHALVDGGHRRSDRAREAECAPTPKSRPSAIAGPDAWTVARLETGNHHQLGRSTHQGLTIGGAA